MKDDFADSGSAELFGHQAHPSAEMTFAECRSADSRSDEMIGNSNMPGDVAPKLELGEPPGRLKRQLGGVSRKWLVSIGILQLATLGLIAAMFARSGPQLLRHNPSGRNTAAELRTIAMELENRSLDEQAASAWEAYLDAAPDAGERAEILYRIGTLYLRADKVELAAAAFVRSQLAAGDDEELKAKLGPRLVTCMRRLGLYGEVGRELSRQVEVGAEGTAKGEVLATVAGEPITEADRDRMIEQRVDQLLTLQGAAGDEQRRQAVLEQFSQPEARQRMFHELLQNSLFTRRARELKLDRDEDFLKARQAMEDDLLAERFLDKELDKIAPTDVDLESYFRAHQDEYQIPESMDAVLIRLAKDEDADKLLAQIESAEQFRTVASARSKETEPSSASGASTHVIRGRFHPELGDPDKLFDLNAGDWTRTPFLHDGARYLVLAENKSPARVPPFSDVRAQVNADYLSRKRSERITQLFQDLMTRYSVNIIKTDGKQAVSKAPVHDAAKGGSP